VLLPFNCSDNTLDIDELLHFNCSENTLDKKKSE